MRADAYNARELGGARLTVSHVTAMTRVVQAELGLEVDGMAGPKTRSAIDSELMPTPAPKVPRTLTRGIVAVAREELGRGEQGGDNRGPDLERWGAPQGHSWCAWFASWVIIEAHRRRGRESPVKPTGGAKALYRAVGRAGIFDDAPLPGDVACWDRGLLAWQGHVGLVVDVDGSAFRTVEGNVGRFPSLVRVYTHELGEPRLEGFSRAW